MNIAIIFAGGTGQRMNSRTKPKQFLELHGKPIIVYTLEQFQMHDKIDGIIVVSIESWIPYCKRLIKFFQLSKVKTVIPGGSSGQESIFEGIRQAHELFPSDSIILIHDGVRPLIDRETISKAIDCVKKKGSAITTTHVTETIVKMDASGKIKTFIERNHCEMARAPQCFLLKDIYNAHCTAVADNKTDFIDSASLMHHYGYDLYTIEGKAENIKITTPSDFYSFRALIDAKENSQIFGI